MAKKDIYTITVVNWHDHNPGKKSTHKKTMIANNFYSDAKVCAMPLSTRWLYLAILLMCGDKANDTITMTERQVNDILTTREGARNALARLESLQLVTVEISPPLITELITEKKNNRKEMNSTSTEKPAAVPTRATRVASRGCINEFDCNDTCKKLLENVTEATQQAWLDAYRDPGPDWIVQEILKANTWMVANPKKVSKDFGRFMTNWLSRSFEAFRKGIPSRRLTPAEVNQQALSELYERVQKGEA